ncbi:glycine cleavage system aminomethyltransferase GcvT [Cutibacterium avidum]|uniref:glycine cleavage system aminomethyltransferase GcvT n=1 Tax=Cutibacterium avidum TaxID=33010 RepID=UPI00083E71C6|nr:glycine cleavage system aminomethyltransferase GcvT [Cutibacterium avidum]AOG27701.1 glycine cleavage system protein T [Cutibacterium avidum]
MTTLRRTPLAAVYESLGASFTDFAGWDMPVRYSSDLAEHHAVRKNAGIFDLSHMGEIRVSGPDAGAALDYALAGKLSAVAEGRAKYSLMLTEDGGVVDDLVTYHLPDGDYLVVANAANTETDLTEFSKRCASFDVTVSDESAQTALVAVQGPEAVEIVLATLAKADTTLDSDEVRDVKYYRCLTGQLDGSPTLVARTGYTGEDGYELYVPAEAAEHLWNLLMEAGGDDLTPCGLACRDTLRLEAGMPLYGHELGIDIHPSQVGLGRVVNFKKEGDFVGRSALENRETTDDRVLVGLAGEGRRAARAGYAVMNEGKEVGSITSGILSPTLGHPIAMAFVDPGVAAVGTSLSVDVRGKALDVTVVELPFYKRS